MSPSAGGRGWAISDEATEVQAGCTSSHHTWITKYWLSEGDVYMVLKGNGNPPQYSCLENPMDGGAWWAIVHWVAQSWTHFKSHRAWWRRAFLFLSAYSGFGLPRWLSSKESACQCRRCRVHPWAGKIPWRRKQQLTPLFLPGKFHARRNMEGYSPRSRKESDKT